MKAGKKVRIKLRIDKKDWAPGVWAGTEGAYVSLDPERYVVEKVDLVKRIITLRSEPVDSSFSAKVIK